MGEAYVDDIMRYSSEVSRWFEEDLRSEVVSWFGVAHVHDHSLLSVPLLLILSKLVDHFDARGVSAVGVKRFRYAEGLFQSTSHRYTCAFTVETLPYRCCRQQTSLGNGPTKIVFTLYRMVLHSQASEIGFEAVA